jgi:hypothetical protein
MDTLLDPLMLPKIVSDDIEQGGASATANQLSG